MSSKKEIAPKKQWSDFSKEEKDKAIKNLSIIGVAILIFIIASATMSSSKPTSNVQTTATTPTTQSTEQETAKTTPTVPVTIQDKLWAAVDTGLKKRDKINIDYSSTDKVAFLEHTDEEPYTAKSFVKQTYSMLVLWGQEAFKIDGVDIINVQNKTKFTDQYGNEAVRTGVTIEMTKAQFSQFNWKNLEYQPIHNSISANSNIYIIVPALLSQIDNPSSDLYLSLSY